MRTRLLLPLLAAALPACLVLEDAERIESPTPTATATATSTQTPERTPTPTPTPTPTNLRSAVIEVIDGAGRPVEGATAFSTLGDAILDESTPTASNGITALLVADDALVTVALSYPTGAYFSTTAVAPVSTWVKLRMSYGPPAETSRFGVRVAGSPAVGTHIDRFIPNELCTGGGVNADTDLAIDLNAICLQTDGSATFTAYDGVYRGAAVDVVPDSPIVTMTMTTAWTMQPISVTSGLLGTSGNFAGAVYLRKGTVFWAEGCPSPYTGSGMVTPFGVDHADRAAAYVGRDRSSGSGQGLVRRSVVVYDNAPASTTTFDIDVTSVPPWLGQTSAVASNGRMTVSWATEGTGAEPDALAILVGAFGVSSTVWWEATLPPEFVAAGTFTSPSLPADWSDEIFDGNYSGAVTLVEADAVATFSDAWKFSFVRRDLPGRFSRSHCSVGSPYVVF